MDATKMPQPEDVTERDLAAVAVETNDESLITDDYTVSQEVDYQIVEQDYEDEMTATQILNQEIARAAEELSSRINDHGDDSKTAEMSLVSITELDVEPLAPADNDDFGDSDHTLVSETATTVDMSEDKTVEIVAEDKTVEIPSSDNDDTTMIITQGRAGSKRG